MSNPTRKPRRDKGVKRKPSEDISYGFRLDTKKDAQAIEIINRFRQRVNPQTGRYYEIREIMTESILRLEDFEPDEKVSIEGIQNTLQQRIDDLDRLIERLQSMELQPQSGKKSNKKQSDIDAGYLANLKRALNRSNSGDSDK